MTPYPHLGDFATLQRHTHPKLWNAAKSSGRCLPRTSRSLLSNSGAPMLSTYQRPASTSRTSGSASPRPCFPRSRYTVITATWYYPPVWKCSRLAVPTCSPFSRHGCLCGQCCCATPWSDKQAQRLVPLLTLRERGDLWTQSGVRIGFRGQPRPSRSGPAGRAYPITTKVLPFYVGRGSPFSRHGWCGRCSPGGCRDLGLPITRRPQAQRELERTWPGRRNSSMYRTFQLTAMGPFPTIAADDIP